MANLNGSLVGSNLSISQIWDEYGQDSLIDRILPGLEDFLNFSAGCPFILTVTVPISRTRQVDLTFDEAARLYDYLSNKQ